MVTTRSGFSQIATGKAEAVTERCEQLQKKCTALALHIENLEQKIARDGKASDLLSLIRQDTNCCEAMNVCAESLLRKASEKRSRAEDLRLSAVDDERFANALKETFASQVTEQQDG